MLTDFGLSKEGIEDTIHTKSFCGSYAYLAPEMVKKVGHGKAVDWWTLGIILYEMIAGIDPFNDEDPMIIYHNILKCKLKFPQGFDSYFYF